MANETTKEFLRVFLSVTPNEIADLVVDDVVTSSETIPINSSDGDPRATAEEHMVFQGDIMQAYPDSSTRAARRDQFLANNTFAIALSGPEDLTPVILDRRLFYSIDLTTFQRHLLRHVNRLVILIRIRDYHTFDTDRRGVALGTAIADALANKTGRPFESILVHFHFEDKGRVSWVMRTFEMQNIIFGMQFGGDLPRCAGQLRFALTDGSSHPAFDPGLVHKSSEEVAVMSWLEQEAAGFAKTAVDTLFEEEKGKQLQVAWA